MRFAYIDSNGNEVPIPSVDALALRIELGAITDETQLYDAQADQWGPATSHEIYHTLVRDSGDEDGFIAPPPVAPPPAAAEVVPGGVVAGEEALSIDDIAPDLDRAPTEVAAAQEKETQVVEPEEVAGGDFGVGDLAPAAGFEPSGAPTLPTAATGDGSNNTLDLAPLPDSDDLPQSIEAIELDAPVADIDADIADTGAFSFGSMEGGLELEGGFDEPEDAMDFSGADSAMGLAGQTGGFEGGADDPLPDFSGGMELESTMDFDAGGFTGGGDTLDLETPMSQFTPDAPPSWMDTQDENDSSRGVMDFSSVSADPDVTRAQAPKGPPKTRPSRPRRPRRSMVGPLVGVVALVAVAAGGYAAWPIAQDWLETRQRPEQIGPVIPPLDAALMQPMRDRADQAFSTLLADARRDRVIEGPDERSAFRAPGDRPGGLRRGIRGDGRGRFGPGGLHGHARTGRLRLRRCYGSQERGSRRCAVADRRGVAAPSVPRRERGKHRICAGIGRDDGSSARGQSGQ
jgi:hypothetical protein